MENDEIQFKIPKEVLAKSTISQGLINHL